MTRTTTRWIIVLLSAAFCLSCGADAEKNDPSDESRRYSLFTWTTSGDNLCFVLVPYHQRENFLRRWFPKRSGKCSATELKRALKALPKSAEVIWEEAPSRGLTYPSATLLDDIQQFGKSQNVDVVMAPILP